MKIKLVKDNTYNIIIILYYETDNKNSNKINAKRSSQTCR